MSAIPISPLRAAGIALLFCALTVGAHAQRSWRVDSAGGPAADFSDLPPAVAAAAPGDTLFVVPIPNRGTYSATRLTKGLRILATGPRTGIERIEVRSVPANQTVLLDGVFVTGGSTASVPGIRIAGCRGPIILRRVQLNGVGGARFEFENSAQVLLRDCSLEAQVYPHRMTNCRVIAEECSLTCNVNIGFPIALELLRSDLTVVRTRIAALAPGFFGPFRAAKLTDSILRLGAGSSLVVPGYPYAPLAGACGSIVELVAADRLVPATVGCVRVTRRDVAATTTTLAVRRQPLVVEGLGSPGASHFFFVGTPIAAPVPTSLGLLWLTPAGAGGYLGSAVAGRNGSARLRVASLPELPIGLLLVFQSLAVTTTPDVAVFSAPSVARVR